MSQKDKLLDYLDESYDQFRASFADLSDTQMSGMVFGTWNVRDIVAHICGWNVVASESLDRMARGESPKPSGVDYSDTRVWDQLFVAERQGNSPEMVIGDFDASFAALRKSVEAMPDGWFEVRRLRVGLLLVEADHYRRHAAQIRQWRDGLQ
ncbi:MAG: ClbS/DfsB family four-helix bundle protein [Chloroflexi bacterium]|nr:ClbS/DfsB family four-helix bundle protein [Chloroflexota bacterium]